MSVKAIFLDKDGTLIDDLSFFTALGAEPRHIRLCSGAGEAVRQLSELDYRLFIVTNQEGIARGAFPAEAIERVHRRIADLLFREHVQLDGFYYCPHHPAGTLAQYAHSCTCRKPQPGLLLQAARAHDIDLSASWMIGSRLHDVEAGSRAGCRTILVDTGNETEWRLGPHRLPTRVVYDLCSAAAVIAMVDQETV
jgi:D,D-heptose 1,7-bisphosphate phosphatase